MSQTCGTQSRPYSPTRINLSLSGQARTSLPPTRSSTLDRDETHKVARARPAGFKIKTLTFHLLLSSVGDCSVKDNSDLFKFPFHKMAAKKMTLLQRIVMQCQEDVIFEPQNLSQDQGAKVKMPPAPLYQVRVGGRSPVTSMARSSEARTTSPTRRSSSRRRSSRRKLR